MPVIVGHFGFGVIDVCVNYRDSVLETMLVSPRVCVCVSLACWGLHIRHRKVLGGAGYDVKPRDYGSPVVVDVVARRSETCVRRPA